MSAPGYNPEFARATNAKRALAEMRRRMREAEEEAQRTERAACAAADAILAAAYEEARAIMARAYEEQPRPKRPAIEIIGEVSAETGIPVHAMRGPEKRPLAVRQARGEAMRRVANERKDLNYAEIGRIFGLPDGGAVKRALFGRGSGGA